MLDYFEFHCDIHKFEVVEIEFNQEYKRHILKI
jgi:hypothetical protein